MPPAAVQEPLHIEAALLIEAELDVLRLIMSIDIGSVMWYYISTVKRVVGVHQEQLGRGQAVRP